MSHMYKTVTNSMKVKQNQCRQALSVLMQQCLVKELFIAFWRSNLCMEFILQFFTQGLRTMNMSEYFINCLFLIACCSFAILTPEHVACPFLEKPCFNAKSVIAFTNVVSVLWAPLPMKMNKNNFHLHSWSHFTLVSPYYFLEPFYQNV